MTKASVAIKSAEIAQRMQQIISSKDVGVVGARILQVVEEHDPDAETFALAILKYRQNQIVIDGWHMEYAHGLMRVMLDALLAKEQSKSQRTQFWASIVMGIASLIVGAAAFAL